MRVEGVTRSSGSPGRARWSASWYRSGIGPGWFLAQVALLLAIIAGCVWALGQVGFQTGLGIALMLVVLAGFGLLVVALVTVGRTARLTLLLWRIRRRHDDVLLVGAIGDRRRVRTVLGVDGSTPNVGIALTASPDGLAFWGCADGPARVIAWDDVEVARPKEITSDGEAGVARWPVLEVGFPVDGTVRHLLVSVLTGLPLGRWLPREGLDALVAELDYLAGRPLDGAGTASTSRSLR